MRLFAYTHVPTRQALLLTQSLPPPHPITLTQQTHKTQIGDDGGGGGPVYRRTAARPPLTTALTELPCGRCPVMDQCREGGPISPQTCVYFAEWLDF
jgi:hypothetical protein